MTFILFLIAIILGVIILRKVRKRTLNSLLLAGGVLIIGLVIYFSLFDQSSESSATDNRLEEIEAMAGKTDGVLDVESTMIQKASDRVAIVHKRVKTSSPILDAEFDIYDVNAGNSRSIPGASDRDYKIIMKVDPEHYAKWTKGMQLVGNYDYSWMEATPRYQKWNIKSRPKIYRRPNEESYVLIFDQEGIVAKRFEAH